MIIYRAAAIAAAVLLAGCQPGGDAAVPGDSNDSRPFSGIAPDAEIRFTGTEPFWGGETQGRELLYRTPENGQGVRIAVERFAGRGGVSLSGKLDGSDFDLMVTPGDCSDGMSDRTYPFVATLMIGKDSRRGCAWTDETGFSGPKAP